MCSVSKATNRTVINPACACGNLCQPVLGTELGVQKLNLQKKQALLFRMLLVWVSFGEVGNAVSLPIYIYIACVCVFV